MSNMDIQKKLEKIMLYERYDHSLRVRDAALRLAELYNCSKEKVEIASLLHDVARDMPLDEMQAILKKSGSHSDFSDPEYQSHQLLHARVGKEIAEKQFGIKDAEILRSIELHTTGGESMSVLDKVLFVADFIEPGRTFSGVDECRALAFNDLDKAVLYIYKFLIVNLLEREHFICESTLQGYNDLVRKSK
jgi:predicted HD superfamily hydrolase involved in NAD metabolism